MFAGLYRNLGNVFRAKLNYTTAAEYYQKAIEIYSKQDEINSISLAGAYYSLAEVLLSTKKI